MTPQPQLTTAQVDAALNSIDARIRAKQLEIDSLNTLRNAAPVVFGSLCQGMRAHGTIDEESEQGLKNAAANYLTSKINWLLMDLEQMQLQRKAFASQQSRVQPAGGILPPNGRVQG